MTTIELLKKIYADFEAVPPNLHSEFKLHSPGQSPVAGEFDGLDGLIAHLSYMQELSGNTMRLEPQSFLADEKWGMVVSRITAERNGRQLDMPGFGLWRFQDGKLIDHWESVSNQARWDDFWS